MKHFLEGVAIVVSGAALGLTLYFQYWQEASLQVGVGQVVLLNAKPRMGLLLSVYNSGAKAGNVLSGKLSWEGFDLPSTMVSPQLETWRFTSEGKRKAVAETVFSYIPPTTIPPHGSQSLIFWFVGETKDRFYTAGDHSLALTLYDGVQIAPVATTSFTLHLEHKDVSDIYDPENATVEIPIHWKTPK